MCNLKTGLREYNRCENCGGKITSDITLTCCCNKRFCSQKCANEYHSPSKKDNSDIPNENCLESRNIAGEENELGNMPVGVDNQADTIIALIDGKEKVGMSECAFKFKENSK